MSVGALLPGQYVSGVLPKQPSWRCVGGGQPQIIQVNESSSQTFQQGELVSVVVTSNVPYAINMGALADPSADGVSSITGAVAKTDHIWGMALTPATNAAAVTSNRNISILLATDDIEFFLRVRASTAGASEVQDIAVGDLCPPLRYNGAGDIQTCFLAAPDGTDGNNKLIITEIPIDRSATDQYPGVWVKVRRAWQWPAGL